MVLNAKAMEWAGNFGLDSAKLKSGKVKIFGAYAKLASSNLNPYLVRSFIRKNCYALERAQKRASVQCEFIWILFWNNRFVIRILSIN